MPRRQPSRRARQYGLTTGTGICRTRHATGRVTKHELRQFRRDINHHIGIQYRPKDSPTDPLLRWFHKHHDLTQPGPPAVAQR